MVVLGGDGRGTITASRLRRRSDADEAEIHVVDRDDRHPVSITGDLAGCAWLSRLPQLHDLVRRGVRVRHAEACVHRV
jgi:hypothetical protein